MAWNGFAGVVWVFAAQRWWLLLVRRANAVWRLWAGWPLRTQRDGTGRVTLADRVRYACRRDRADGSALAGWALEPLLEGTALEGTALEGTALEGTALEGTGLVARAWRQVLEVRGRRPEVGAWGGGGALGAGSG